MSIEREFYKLQKRFKLYNHIIRVVLPLSFFLLIFSLIARTYPLLGSVLYFWILYGLIVAIYFLLKFLFDTKAKRQSAQQYNLKTVLIRETEFRFPVASYSPRLVEKGIGDLPHDEITQIKNEFSRDFYSNLKPPLMSLAIIVLALGASGLPLPPESIFSALFQTLKGPGAVNYQVITGHFEGEESGAFSKEDPTLSLLSDNLLRIDLRSTEPLQETPQLIFEPSHRSESTRKYPFSHDDASRTSWTVTLRVPSQGTLKTSHSGNQSLNVKITDRVVPTVELSTIDDVSEALLDNQPLNLNINVRSETPLADVQLKIEELSNEGASYSEEISKIEVGGVFSLERPHVLNLKKYAGDQRKRLRIWAEAKDKSQPMALTGISNSITIEVINSYGHYIEILDELRQQKEKMSQCLSEQECPEKPNIKTSLKKAIEKASQSAFFTGYDRVILAEIQGKVNIEDDSTTIKNLLNWLDAYEDLSSFLYDHENANDRERDRDFFVALRNLSRLLDRKDKKGFQHGVESLSFFLRERERRWKQRAEQIGRDRLPKGSESILDKQHFSKKAERLATMKDSQKAKELAALSLEYQGWLEVLEGAEDSFVKEKRQQYEESLKKAEDKLKEMQGVQDEISAALDKSTSSAERPSLRDEERKGLLDLQKKNLEGAMGLAQEVEPLTPDLANRIKAAGKAMENAAKGLTESDDELAEDQSDLAARLLRYAQNSAKQNRPNQERRPSPDDYHGGNVISGDIELQRDYQIDSKYREDLLEEYRSKAGEVDRSEQEVIKNYLRGIIR